jgi:hypothetical protein
MVDHIHPRRSHSWIHSLQQEALMPSTDTTFDDAARMDPRTITLKCNREFFGYILDGTKTFEMRKDDRGFKVGDRLLLKEWDTSVKEGVIGQSAVTGLNSVGPIEGVYTGREVTVEVTYKLPGARFGVEEGYCVLGIKPLSEKSAPGKSGVVDASVRAMLARYPSRGFVSTAWKAMNESGTAAGIEHLIGICILKTKVAEDAQGALSLALNNLINHANGASPRIPLDRFPEGSQGQMATLYGIVEQWRNFSNQEALSWLPVIEHMERIIEGKAQGINAREIPEQFAGRLDAIFTKMWTLLDIQKEHGEALAAKQKAEAVLANWKKSDEQWGAWAHELMGFLKLNLPDYIDGYCPPEYQQKPLRLEVEKLRAALDVSSQEAIHLRARRDELEHHIQGARDSERRTTTLYLDSCLDQLLHALGGTTTGSAIPSFWHDGSEKYRGALNAVRHLVNMAKVHDEVHEAFMASGLADIMDTANHDHRSAVVKLCEQLKDATRLADEAFERGRRAACASVSTALQNAIYDHRYPEEGALLRQVRALSTSDRSAGFAEGREGCIKMLLGLVRDSIWDYEGAGLDIGNVAQYRANMNELLGMIQRRGTSSHIQTPNVDLISMWSMIAQALETALTGNPVTVHSFPLHAPAGFNAACEKVRQLVLMPRGTGADVVTLDAVLLKIEKALNLRPMMVMDPATMGWDGRAEQTIFPVIRDLLHDLNMYHKLLRSWESRDSAVTARQRVGYTRLQALRTNLRTLLGGLDGTVDETG